MKVPPLFGRGHVAHDAFSGVGYKDVSMGLPFCKRLAVAAWCNQVDLLDICRRYDNDDSGVLQ